MILRAELFFQWESLCFLVSGLLKMDFSMKVFVFLVWGLLKIDFSMKAFVFLDLGLLNFDFFNENTSLGFRPIENWFFNETVCFFGLRHCGRRCWVRFFKWIYSVFKTWINFSMRVFFLVSSLLKISMKVFVFLVSGLLKMDFSMRVFVFLVLGIVEDGAVPFCHLNL